MSTLVIALDIACSHIFPKASLTQFSSSAHILVLNLHKLSTLPSEQVMCDIYSAQQQAQSVLTQISVGPKGRDF